ncbi:MAG: AAA family ATPase, partial [Actinomycetota bacterium]
MSATRAAGQAQLLSYLPRLSREWASRPEQRRRLIDGSLVFADLSGFTSMTERLASLGRRGAEEVSAIISETFAAMLTEAYRAGGSLLKFGGDALLLLFDGPEHARDAAWGAWGMRQALRTQGTFDTKVGRIRLGMTSAISTGPVHVFMVGEGQKELLVAGPTVSMLMDLERRAARGETLLSEGTVAGLPAGAVTKNQAGLARLSRTPPEAAPRSIDTPTPASSILPFLPPAVRHRHRENEDTLEHRHIAVGFVGIEGLDRLIAADPDRAASALHRVVAATEEAASAHQAWLLATDVARDGAKLIVTAGAPVATGHDEAALLLTLRSLLDLEAELDIRLGANHGTVFFGDIGPSYRRTLTVMGDTVNTAARLMGSAPPDAILAPATMLDSRRVDLEHRAVREMVLRGRKAALQVAEVTGRSTVRRSQEDGPLLGRDRELEALRALLKQAASGRGGTVEVLGPPGSGRSRVAEALLAEADVPSGRLEASLNEQSTPYAVVRRLFTQITGIEPSAPGAASRLRELAASLVPELEPDLAFVTRAMGIDGQDETSLLGVDPRFLPAMTTRSLVTVLDAASPRPLLMVLDDAHLTDSASVEVLRRLGERSSRRPWLLCLTSPEPLNWDWGGVRPAAVELRPLSDDEIVRLAKALTDDRPLSTHELHQVTARAAGNPLALREILSARRQGVELDAIPTAVEGLAAMRIDRLDTRRRRQLEVAAVLGYSFDPSVYESVAGSGVGDLTGWDDDFLEQLDDGRIRFVNPLIRDVIYNRLPFAHRIELHDTVATTLRDRRAVAAEQAAHTLAAER